MARFHELPFKDGVDAIMTANGIAQAAEFSDQCADAVAWRATYLGHLAGLALQKLGVCPDNRDGQPLQLPARLLLEFGAVLQLALWEQDGFSAHLDAGLPSYADAMSDLAARTEHASWDSDAIRIDSLSFDVFRLSLDEFSWDAPSMLGVDVQLKASNEDEFVERLAEFLWRNRQLIQLEQQNEGNADGS